MNRKGYFGKFGGKFVPETVIPALDQLENYYFKIKNDKTFKKELNSYMRDFVGRPTPLYFAKQLTKFLRGPKIFIKREDLCHTGSHKINNAIGQALVARGMGKKRIIAETGAGQHGVAVATVAAMFNIECDVYMGTEDIKRQALNVHRMKLLGSRVIPVNSGTKTLKDAINEAIKDWVTNIRTTYYMIGSAVGPHPYPTMVRDFQSVIGKEARKQIIQQAGRLPDCIFACVGGGSNSIGIFHPFLKDKKVKLVGVEAGGLGLTTDKHGATLSAGRPGILHGTYSYLLQDTDGQILATHSIAAGLDYPGVGPEHSFLKESGRVKYISANDKEALAAFRMLSLKEGIIPALESSHALAGLVKNARKFKKNEIVIVNLSGRGDKDMGMK